ncbi:MAG: Abi-alpha family protein [Planctomycetota bacterium]
MKDVTGLGKALNSEVTKRTYEDVVSPAAKEVGKMGGEVAKALRWFTTPFALAGAYRDRIEPWLDSIRNSVPDERKVESPPEIAGPVLEAMRFRETDSVCGQMFEELLKSSIDSNKQSLTHPAFPKLIDEMSVHEAVIFERLCRAKSDLSNELNFNSDVVDHSTTSFWITMTGENKGWVVSALYEPNKEHRQLPGQFHPYASLELNHELFVDYERLVQMGLCRETHSGTSDRFVVDLSHEKSDKQTAYLVPEFMSEIDWYTKLHATLFGLRFAKSCNLAGISFSPNIEGVSTISTEETLKRFSKFAYDQVERNLKAEAKRKIEQETKRKEKN